MMFQAEPMADDEETPDESPGGEETTGAVDEPMDEAPVDEPVAEEPTPVAEEAAPAPAQSNNPDDYPRPKHKPEDDVIVVKGRRRPEPPPTAQELDNEDALYAEDLQRGHIKPETMQDLYGKKDTLGKIGTLFGLLVSGMGSGLSGQPNAVLAMMQKEIDNDLDAQKTSNANAQNWLRLSQAHERQKADIGKISAETETEKAHKQGIDQDNYIKALNAAKTRAQLGAVYKMYGITDKLPDGPTKQNAQGVLANTIVPAFNADRTQRNAEASSLLTARSALRGDQDDVKLVDASKILKLERDGAFAAQQGMPPTVGMTPAQAGAARDEAALVNQNRTMYKSWRNMFEKLDKQFITEKLNQEDYNAATAPLIAQMSQGMSAMEAEKIGHALFPAWKDWGKARETKAQQGMDHFKIMEAKTPNLDAFPGLKPPFPGPPEVTKGKHDNKSPKGAPKVSAKGVSKSGRPTIIKNGKVYYAK